MGDSSYLYPASSNSKYGGSAAIGSSAEQMKNIGGGFGQGFGPAYSGTVVIGSPFLAYRAAKQEKARVKMQADLARLQSNSMYTASDDVKRAGAQEVAKVSYAAGQAKSNSRVAMAASGVSVGASGSSAEVLAGIDIVRDIQCNQIEANAIAESWGYRKKAVEYSNKALAYDLSAKQINPWFAAISELNSQISSNGSELKSIGSSVMGLFGGGSDGSYSSYYNKQNNEGIMSMFNNFKASK